MDIIYEKIREQGEVKLKNIEGKESQQARQQPPPPLPPSPPSSSAASPPSASSSPSHEFSFTISLQPSTQRTPPTPSFALDLSPADDIFFHGHLLPLHLLSHLPLSPRSSTIKDFTEEKNQNPLNNNVNGDDHEVKTRSKSKSFSIFGLPKRRKSCEIKEKEKEEHEKNKTKLRFDVSHVLKKYLRMIRPFLSLKSSSRREENMHFQRQAYSFSGNTSFRDDDEKIKGKRIIQYSAPASMRTSPNNSGPLLGNGGYSITSSTSDSTMEELQAAIQAAITHCKNSNGRQEKQKL